MTTTTNINNGGLKFQIRGFENVNESSSEYTESVSRVANAIDSLAWLSAARRGGRVDTIILNPEDCDKLELYLTIKLQPKNKNQFWILENGLPTLRDVSALRGGETFLVECSIRGFTETVTRIGTTKESRKISRSTPISYFAFVHENQLKLLKYTKGEFVPFNAKLSATLINAGITAKDIETITAVQMDKFYTRLNGGKKQNGIQTERLNHMVETYKGKTTLYGKFKAQQKAEKAQATEKPILAE